MPKNIRKSLQCYISKIKKSNPNIESISSPKNWILSGCRHPKTPSFAINQDQKDVNSNNEAATLSDIDKFLFENFKSLYIAEDEETSRENKGHHSEGYSKFLARQGKRSSFDDARSSGTTTSEEIGSSTISTNTLDHSGVESKDGDDVALPNDCIALVTYSPNPYDDFRGSMQDMVDAKLKRHGKVDWEFMEELLFCYLNLNEKKLHKYILSAFVDLVVFLRQNDHRDERPLITARERRKRRVKLHMSEVV